MPDVIALYTDTKQNDPIVLRRLYWLVGHSGLRAVALRNEEHTQKTIEALKPFKLLLALGKDVHMSYAVGWGKGARIVELPAPLDPKWDTKSLAIARDFIQNSKRDLDLSFRGKRLVVNHLIPF